MGRPFRPDDATAPPFGAVPLIIASISACVLLLWIPTTVRLFVLHLPGEPFTFYLFDVAMVVLILSWIVHERPVRGLPQLPIIAAVPVVLLAAGGVVAAFTGPTLEGWLLLYRFFGAVVLGCFLSRLHQDDRVLILFSLIVVGFLEAVLAVVQVIQGEDLGLYELGERIGLYNIQETIVPLGTFFHPYWLAGLLCLATGVTVALALRKPRLSTFLIAGVISTPIGLILSRASLIAVIPLVAVVAISCLKDRRIVPLLLALTIGMGTTALLRVDSWLGRVDSSLTPSYDQNGSGVGGRLMLAREAVALIRKHPVVGVGHGRYIEAADRDLGPGYSGEISHSAPLLVAAELGLAAGMAFLFLMVAAGRNAMRSGAGAIAVFVSFLPFVLLDAYTYSEPQGLVLTATWLATSATWGARSQDQIPRIPRDLRAPTAAISGPA